jgi:hypothetical protein
MIFSVPIAVTVFAAIAFRLLFSEQKYQQTSAAIEEAEASGRPMSVQELVAA